MMNKLLLVGLLTFQPPLNAKTLTYTWLQNAWWCEERVSTGKHSSNIFLKPCSPNNLWDIYNRDDVTWLKDAKMNTNTYNEYKPSKPVNHNCGLRYNPKTGVTYNYPKCEYTFKY